MNQTLKHCDCLMKHENFYVTKICIIVYAYHLIRAKLFIELELNYSQFDFYLFELL